MRGLAIARVAGHFVCFSLLTTFACAARPVARPSTAAHPEAGPGLTTPATSRWSEHPAADAAQQPLGLQTSQAQPEPLRQRENFPQLEGQLPDSLTTWTVNEGGRFRLEAFGPLGSWVALCSRRDASLRLFAPASSGSVQLGLSGAIPRKVDRLVGWSARGRYLATLEGSRLFLLDLSLGAELDLSSFQPDLRSDRQASLRTLAFAGDEHELALLKEDSSIVLIDLPFSSLSYRSVVPSHRPWRVRYSGHYLIAESGAGGSWPVPPAQQSPLRCAVDRSVALSFSRQSEPNAAFTRQTELLSRTEKGASFQTAPGFVMTFGAGWIRREDDGRLLLVEGRVQKQLTSARCGARIRYADDLRRLLLVACEKYRPRPEPANPKEKKKKKPEYSFPLYLIGPGSVRELGLSDARASYDFEASLSSTLHGMSSPELIPWMSEGQAILIDLNSRSAHTLAAGERVLTTQGRIALVRQGSRIVPVEFDLRGARRERKAIFADEAVFEDVQLAGSHVAIGSVILHPTAPNRVLETSPIALDQDGAALLATDHEHPWFAAPLVISRPERSEGSPAPTDLTPTAPRSLPPLR